MGLTLEPQGVKTEELVLLDALEREWLSKQAPIAEAFARLRAHVRETGGQAPTAYPSVALLARARGLLSQASRELGALTRGLEPFR